MSSYDFRILSPIEFEVLCRDLLGADLETRFESFKPGRDQGVDLRAFADNNEEIIAQCKHYVGSGFSKLKSNLKLVETPKLGRIEPVRYIIMTSVPLSRSQKSQLAQAVSPYCQSPSDVYGAEDLNSLLSIHPEIERTHYKLWITSTNVLDRLVNADMFQRAEMERHEIEERLALHVQTKATQTAWDILEKHNYCIISGLPGIGKTTLAEILVADFVSRDFELLVARSHVDEVLPRIKAGKQYIVYYDDFLGQSTFSEKLGKNEEQSLLRLLKLSQRHSSLKVVLTTREYLLADAQSEYEKLADPAFDIGKCVIDLDTYNRGDRARILYNHLFFFGIDDKQLDSILDGDRYLKIIDHPNYSPRVIEWVVKSGRRESSVFEELKAGLDDPLRIWSNVFDKQLGEDARDLLLGLSTLRSTTKLDSLQKVFLSTSGRGCREDKVERRFRDSLRTLDGTFLSIKRDRNQTLVEFANPSIRDFVRLRIAESPTIQRALIVGSVFFEQLEEVVGRRHDKNKLNARFDDLAKPISRLFFAQPDGVHRVYAHRRSNSYSWWPDRRSIGRRAKDVLFWSNHADSPQRFQKLLVDLLEQAFENSEFDDVGDLCDMIEVLLSLPHPDEVSNLAITKLIESADEGTHLFDWAKVSELVVRYPHLIPTETLAEAANDSMKYYLEDPSFDDEDERDYDCGRMVEVAKVFDLEILDEIESLKNSDVGSDWRTGDEESRPRRGPIPEPDLTDSEIAELFTTLRG